VSTLRRRVEKIDSDFKRTSTKQSYTLILMKDGETHEQAITRTGNKNIDISLIHFVKFIDPKGVD